jgi:CHAT domain-containing protein/tetratricopeptide (TPR) repeat protein
LVSGQTLTAQPAQSNASQARQFQLTAYEYSKKAAYDSSIILFSKARDLYQKLENWEEQVKCNNFIADNFARKAEFGHAMSCLSSSLKIAQMRLTADNPELAQTYNLLGYVHYYTQGYDSAVTYLHQALKIREKNLGENHVELGHTLYTLGITYRAMGKYDEASSAIDRALRICDESGSKEDAAIYLVALANIFSDKGNYANSISLSTRAISLLRELGKENSREMANCCLCLGRDFIKMNQLANAAAFLTKSLSINKALFGESHPAVSACYSYLGDISALKGDYDLAILYYAKACEIISEVNGENHSSLAELYACLSDIHSHKHDFQAALKFAESSLRIQSHNYGDDHLLTANSLEKVARVHEEMGNFTDALLYYQRSLKIKSRVAGSGSAIVGQVYLSMGIAFSKASKFDSARYCLEMASEIAGKSVENDRVFAASIRKALGDLLVRKKEISSSLVHYQEAIALLTGDSADTSSNRMSREGRTHPEPLLLECRVAKAKALQSLYSTSNAMKHLEAAHQEYERAINVISTTRKSYRAEGSRAFFGEECYGIYKEAVKTALMLYAKTNDSFYKVKAFACAERAKANLLNDKMLDADAIRFSGAPESLLEREASLKAGLMFYETQAEKAEKNNDTVKANESRNEYFTLTLNYGNLLDTLEALYPRYFELKYKDDPIDIGQIQSSLDSNTTLIDYFFVDSTLCIFSISKKSFDITLRKDAEKITQTAARLRRSLKTFDEQEYLTTAPRLARMVLPPIGRQRIGDHIVIIPDGELYYIPFEALLTRPQKADAAVDYRTLPYLVRKYAISYSYSSTLFAKRGKTDRISKEPSFIGFAPVFSDSADNNRVIASNEPYGQASDGMSTLRSISIDGKKFNQLEYTKTEISGIAQLFQEHHLKQTICLYRNANKQSFKQLTHEYSYVHVASHGYADEDHPDLSGLLFSPPHDTLDEDDGILRTRETYGLNLDADLVVLSSCESGVGKLVKGEGLVALTRGFFYSGARNIVFSLWKVPDKHTSDLMTAFYACLLSGQDFSTAMRNAKLKMLNNPLSAFPTKWTGFVLLSSN